MEFQRSRPECGAKYMHGRKNPPLFTSISARPSYLFTFHRSSFGGFWDDWSPPRQRSAKTENL